MDMPAVAADAADGDLTARQREVLCHVLDGLGAGRCPTYRDLMAALGIASANGVACHVEALVRKGYLVREPFAARAFLAGPRLAGLSVSRDGDLVVVRSGGVPVLRLSPRETELLADLLDAARGG